MANLECVSKNPLFSSDVEKYLTERLEKECGFEPWEIEGVVAAFGLDALLESSVDKEQVDSYMEKMKEAMGDGKYRDVYKKI